MIKLWILLIVLYGVFKGLREVLKKKSMEKHSVIEVLFFYTLFAFFMTIPFSINQGILDVSLKYHIAIFIKSFVIFLAWLCALNSIKRLPLSIYGVMDMGRMLFSIILSVIFLGETIGLYQGIGMTFVLLGVTLVNFTSSKKKGENTTLKVLPLVFASCVLNACSGVADKFLLSTSPNRLIFGAEILTPTQMQFWYMLYLTALYGIYILLKREKVNVKKCVASPWIWVLSALFITADKALFIANADPDSRVVVMTLIKQCSVLVTILMGRIVYKEKNIFLRLLCAIIIIAGITISVL
ncbi:MAG: DMT family transporter [Ruminococcaceae bacterium]|nr:DMT family transporter [Oscillospiraceae bacterium]